MLQFLLFAVFNMILMCASNVRSHDEVEERLEHVVETDRHKLSVDMESTSDMKGIIQKLEETTAHAEKYSSEGIIPIEQAEKLQDQIAERLDEIIVALADTHGAYRFINEKGIERVILSNINTNFPQVKGRILTLIKILFDMIPNTTHTMMPNSLVDKMIDVFENENLDLKEISLDILYHWLPNNPKLQARVMKLKGLEAFYQQISKLDMKVNLKLFSLFNKILEEHIEARDQSKEIQSNDNSVKLYQMIGLIERMSTPYICNGLLNVIEILISKEKSVQLPVVELMKNVKSFCFEVYRGKKKAINLFDNFYNILSNESNKSSEELPLNITEIKGDIQEYLMKLKVNVRNEL